MPIHAAMYEEFYRFGQPPFTLAPDPRFLYRSESHDEAITRLLQSIRRKEGFILLTGDIGTGKTTVCRALLQQLDVNTFTSLILNPFLSVEELLREILLDFGVVSREAVRSGRLSRASKHELITTLQEFLMSLMAIRGSGVLIIDEAQHLAPEVLEQIRVISNLETNDSKLLQIVLVGQLNLLDSLAAADMRQLDQRISLRAVLKPLTRDEVEAYIAHRLWVAKGADAVRFDSDAVATVHGISSGVPRVINLLCDRALMLGAEMRVNIVTPAMIEDAATRLGITSPMAANKARVARARGWGLVAAAAALAIAALLVFAPLYRLVDAPPPPRPRSPATRIPTPFTPVPPEQIEFVPQPPVAVQPPGQ
jgi:general secretion pathway protein A